jgi:hypothetical protein
MTLSLEMFLSINHKSVNSIETQTGQVFQREAPKFTPFKTPGSSLGFEW